jgi:hypothetical protein
MHLDFFFDMVARFLLARRHELIFGVKPTFTCQQTFENIYSFLISWETTLNGGTSWLPKPGPTFLFLHALRAPFERTWRSRPTVLRFPTPPTPKPNQTKPISVPSPAPNPPAPSSSARATASAPRRRRRDTCGKSTAARHLSPNLLSSWGRRRRLLCQGLDRFRLFLGKEP